MLPEHGEWTGENEVSASGLQEQLWLPRPDFFLVLVECVCRNFHFAYGKIQGIKVPNGLGLSLGRVIVSYAEGPTLIPSTT